MTLPPNEKASGDSWGLDNVEQTSAWARDTQKRLRELGEKLGAGALTQVYGFGLQRHWALAGDPKKGLLCAGFRRALQKENVDQTMKHVYTKWVS